MTVRPRRNTTLIRHSEHLVRNNASDRHIRTPGPARAGPAGAAHCVTGAAVIR
ncbi:hypothetical protein FTUN_2552 [Frigoriglobus tundricola]|uniref:Uncharacterized protein n=1 Tax=Frigoriglobus tundricola TaxID=2774151 RepID=A0A6M5YNW5_9BACT|nr:hypothetical protein FTUN_2552 [Frigoriglobus tundricola]